MHTASQWSDLPQDLLISILGRLDFGSIIRCMAICTCWNYAIKQIRRLLLSARDDRPPWMLYPDNDQNYKLFDLSTNSLYHHRIDSLPIDGRCLGSSDGWLVIVEFSCKNIQFLNPLTRAHFHVPLTVTYPIIDTTGQISYEMHCTESLSKIIFCRSPNSSMGYLLAGLRNDDRLATIKEGDDAWKLQARDIKELHCDIAFCRGKVYVLTRWMQLYVWEVRQDSSFIFEDKVEPITINRSYFKMKYLIVCSDELLCVAKDEVATFDKTVQVFKYDVGHRKWNEIKNLGDNVALFSSHHTHISLFCCDLYGFQRNCIYFTQNSRLINYTSDNCSCSFQKFCLDDGKFNDYEPFLLPAGWQARPICFIPSIL